MVIANDNKTELSSKIINWFLIIIAGLMMFGGGYVYAIKNNPVLVKWNEINERAIESDKSLMESLDKLAKFCKES